MYGSKKLQGFKKTETNVQNFTFQAYQATTKLKNLWGSIKRVRQCAPVLSEIQIWYRLSFIVIVACTSSETVSVRLPHIDLLSSKKPDIDTPRPTAAVEHLATDWCLYKRG
jgi:hypothetical protein